MVNPDEDGAWVNRRWAEHVAPLAEVTWVADDGIRYLRPETVLLFKARLRRPKDDHDLRSALPLLSVEQVAWLRTAVAATEPGHAWLELL